MVVNVRSVGCSWPWKKWTAPHFCQSPQVKTTIIEYRVRPTHLTDNIVTSVKWAERRPLHIIHRPPMTSSLPAEPVWLETVAEVTACKYQFARMNTLTMGLPLDRNQFLITFAYHADGKTYTDDFTSPTYLEDGTTFLLTYNPLAPQQNSKSASASNRRASLVGIAVAGSVVLSILYLALLRGCS